MRQIILDTETTGLQFEQGHRIIEIGCLELINRKLTGKRYHQFINPEREIEAGAEAVHGITNQFLKDKPIFSTISEELMDFLSGAELIIHNAPFDVGFINHELSLLGKKWKPITHYCRIVDTLVIARKLHVGQRNSLDALCKRYGIDNSQRELHGALLDAHLLCQVYLAMTGGQSSLFEESQQTETVAKKSESILKTEVQVKNLFVQRASGEELELHEAILKKMREKGKCEWQEER